MKTAETHVRCFTVHGSGLSYFAILSRKRSSRLVTFTSETPESKSSDTRLSIGEPVVETFLDALGNHVVSDAAERLERDDVVHAITDVTYDVGRQKPAFAKLGCEPDQSLYVLRIIIDIGERTE